MLLRKCISAVRPAATQIAAFSLSHRTEVVKGMVKKKTIVFGGTSGIGLAAAVRLRDAGANVTVVGRTGRLSAEGNTDVSGIEVACCDVLNRSDLQKLLESVAPIDVLVSSATGGSRAEGPFLSMDLDAYQGSFAKLWGYTNVVRHGAPLVSPGGCIVLVSGSPARRPKPGQVALASVGAAVEQFARAVAPELASRQVRINVVSPGMISTPMFGTEGAEERTSRLAAGTAANLIPRAGTADEVAKAIYFCVENDFITGTTVDVDGGWLSRP